jgi:hypothetical protein
MMSNEYYRKYWANHRQEHRDAQNRYIQKQKALIELGKQAMREKA